MRAVVAFLLSICVALGMAALAMDVISNRPEIAMSVGCLVFVVSPTAAVLLCTYLTRNW